MTADNEQAEREVAVSCSNCQTAFDYDNEGAQDEWGAPLCGTCLDFVEEVKVYVTAARAAGRDEVEGAPSSPFQQKGQRPGKETKMPNELARVVWIRRDELDTGELRHGEWVERSVAEAAVEAGNRDYPEIAHLIELPRA